MGLACAAWCLYLFVGVLMDGPAVAMCSAVGLRIQVTSSASAALHKLREGRLVMWCLADVHDMPASLAAASLWHEVGQC